MQVLRYTAFATTPEGGNPAGVVLDAGGAGSSEMLAVAADVGYSETAFLTEADGQLTVRYFSPLAEVPFCGHATIAAAVAWADQNGPGPLVFHTRAGPVAVRTRREDGTMVATLTSVPPRVDPLDPVDLGELLTALRWSASDLDPELAPRVAYAGAHHPVIAAATQERLADLDYDFERLGVLMAAHDWTTVALVRRAEPTVFHARAPFPPGGVVEDPATGAAAAALGGYLRALGLVELPARVTVHQGAYVGRPGRLDVDIPADTNLGIDVTGAAVPIG